MYYYRSESSRIRWISEGPQIDAGFYTKIRRHMRSISEKNLRHRLDH